MVVHCFYVKTHNDDLKKNNLLTLLHTKPRRTLIFSNAFDCYCRYLLDILYSFKMQI